MDLFTTKGYTATTVAEIAAAADVSHTTFFRYFPTKEDVIVLDDLGELETAALHSIEPGLDRFALLHRITDILLDLICGDPWASSQARHELIEREPELRMAAQIHGEARFGLAREFVSQYFGLPADDFALRVLLAAFIGIAMQLSTEAESVDDAVRTQLHDAVDLLARGLPLG